MNQLSTHTSFEFACPICQSRLDASTLDMLRCATDATAFRKIDGIWRLMRPDRVARFAQFVKEYATVRLAEGRGSDDAAYYRALPFADLTGRMIAHWKIRAASYRALIDYAVAPLERRAGAPLKILDLGAGNGWLSYQLARRGHTVGAVDLSTERADGLGAFVHYDAAFTPIQAEFDHLPLTEQQIDIAIFNASFHYSVNYETTLAEAWRVVRPEGRVVILDSPLYSDPASGRRMVRERQARFQRAYGFPSDSLGNEGFLTFKRLDELAAAAQTKWRLVQPAFGWRWAVRLRVARLRARREPARFALIIGARRS